MTTSPIILFFKSHVETYTRQDGTVVHAHDDKRTKSAEPAKTAEAKIRSAVNAATMVIGKPTPIMTEHNGVKVPFMARIERITTPSEQARGLHSVIHLMTVRKGRMLAGDDLGWIAKHYTLDGKNNLKDSKTMPQKLSIDEANEFFNAHNLPSVS